MHDLEHELRSALKRKDPPADFAAGVLARLPKESVQGYWRKALSAICATPHLRWVAATSLAGLLIAVGVVHLHQMERERAQAEAARAQLMQALHIASSKLNGTWRKVQEPEQQIPPS